MTPLTMSRFWASIGDLFVLRTCAIGNPTCGKEVPKWLLVVRIEKKPVENVSDFGQKFLISRFDPTPAPKVWHSITRSSRSTCR